VAFSSLHSTEGGTIEGDVLWVEILAEDSSMPPNIADTRFRVVPKLQFDAQERYDMSSQKVQRSRPRQKRRDSRQNVNDGEDIAMLAIQEEHASNVAEARQRQGKKLRFGDMLQLQHVVTGLYITVLTNVTAEHGAKRVRLTKGSPGSVFLLEPAFKTYSTGDQVRSGDQVVFRTADHVNGEHLYLNMSRNLGGTSRSPDALKPRAARQLQLDVRHLKAVAEIAACADADAAGNGAIWRPIISSAWKDVHVHKEWLKAQDVVCLYHKEGEKFLYFDPASSRTRPQLYPSTRVSDKERKKSSWLWIIETVGVEYSGGQVNCSNAVGVFIVSTRRCTNWDSSRDR